jgi:hypothetical protein
VRLRIRLLGFPEVATSFGKRIEHRLAGSRMGVRGTPEVITGRWRGRQDVFLELRRLDRPSDLAGRIREPLLQLGHGSAQRRESFPERTFCFGPPLVRVELFERGLLHSRTNLEPG